MKRINIYIVIFFVLVAFFSGCKKKEDKILGTWKYIYISTSDINKVQIWTFNEDKSLIRTISDTLADTAIWSVDKEIFNNARLVISNSNDNLDGTGSVNGTYEMLTLNRKYLIVQRFLLSNGSSEGAFKRLEFKKSN